MLSLLLFLAALLVLWRDLRGELGTPGVAALSVALAALLVLAALVLRALQRGQRHQQLLLDELRSTTENLREAQQIAHMGYWERDLKAGTLLVSPELGAVLAGVVAPGLHRTDALSELVHPEDRARVLAAAEAAIETGEPFDVEHRVELPGVGTRVLRTRGALGSRADGQPCLSGTSQDISGPAAVRERLHRAQAQYRLLFERNPLPMWIYDVESLRFLAVNAAAIAHYGYSEAEFLARTLHDIRPAEDAAEMDTVVRSWDEADRRARVWRHLRRDGSLRYVTVYSSDIAFEERPARLALVQDVTDRVRAEEERTRSELRFSIVARAASDAIYDWDIARGAIWWSDGFYEIFGYAPGRLAPSLEAWQALIHPDDAPTVIGSLERALAGSADSWEGAYRFRRDDGQFAEVEDRGQFLRDADGVAVRMIGAMLDVTARRAGEARLRVAQAELAHRATHDPLTGLPNRTLITDRLAAQIRRTEQGGASPVAVFVGLDHFKLINDTLGHAVGDRVLAAVAERLRAVVPASDTVGRFGGDEFVVLFDQQGDAHTRAVLERIAEALSRPLDTLDTLHYLTPSIGWGVHPQAGADAETLLKNVDLAMYQAKQRGRNNVVRYAPELGVAVAERLGVVSRLRRALANGEFALHFQPKYELGGLTPVGVEALLRWNDPDRGLVAPAAFIAVAEDSGLIVPIGRWVLREAARHHALLDRAGFGALSIAVNVAPPQFQRGQLLEDVRSLLAELSLPPGALEIELTEGVILDAPERAIAQMAELHALGVSVAIDDFGTGYSSLGYLKRLPVDVLKIDRSFIADLGHDREAEAVCTAIITLAQSLGRIVVAEGVEEAQQLAWLRNRGCDLAQGFLLARPQPFEQLLATLATPLAAA